MEGLLEEAESAQYGYTMCITLRPTTLLLLGVQERAVMDVMSWSTAAMVKRYAHPQLRRDIAHR